MHLPKGLSAIAVMWMLSGHACSSGSRPGEPRPDDRASAAGPGSAAAAAAPPASAKVGTTAGSPSPPASGKVGHAAGSPSPPPSVTAAPPAPCLASNPDASGGWLEAIHRDGVLQICAVEFYGDPSPKGEPRHDTCVGIDLPGGAPVKVANQALATPREPRGSLVIRAGKPTACAADGTCRPVGKRLSRAIPAAAGDKLDQHVAISADGELAITSFGNPPARVWDIAKDRQLGRFAPPRMERSSRDAVSFSFLGDLIMASWEPCDEGPCETHRIFRRDGKLVVDEIEAETGVRRLPDGNVAVMRDKLAIYDPKRARLVHTIDVVPPGLERIRGNDPDSHGDMADPLVPLPDGLLAVVVRGKEKIELAVTDVNHGRVTRRLHAPVCAP